MEVSRPEIESELQININFFNVSILERKEKKGIYINFVNHKFEYDSWRDLIREVKHVKNYGNL